MSKLQNYIFLIAFFLVTSCDINEWPEEPERVPFYLRFNYETTMTQWMHLYNGSDGKSLLVYNQNLDITLNSCTFNDNGNISGKAAIETGVDNGNTKYTIKINDTKVNGFDVTGQNAVTYGGTNLGTNVWGNKNLITAENLDVIIDGVTVY